MRLVGYVTCTGCNSKASIMEDSRYNGLRGICFECGGNWPESQNLKKYLDKMKQSLSREIEF